MEEAPARGDTRNGACKSPRLARAAPSRADPGFTVASVANYVRLQYQIATADDVRSAQRADGTGQVYYEYKVAGAGAHSLISVTCARNKLYVHESFKTIQPGAPPPATET